MACFGLEAGMCLVTKKREDVRTNRPVTVPKRLGPSYAENVSFMDSRIMNCLVRDSAEIFAEAQEIGEDGERQVRRDQVVHVSQKYRSLIHTAVRNHEEDRFATHDGLNASVSQVLLKIDLIWHLTEILFMDPQAGNLILMQELMNWVNSRFTTTTESASALMLDEDGGGFGSDEDSDSERPIEDKPGYWETVWSALLHLQFDVARDLLKANSESDDSTFKVADELLGKASRLINDLCYRLSPQEYVTKRKALATESLGLLTAGEFSIFPQLAMIPQLLGFKVDLLEDAMPRLNLKLQWYELLPGVLFFSLPDRPTTSHVPAAASRCLQLCRVGDSQGGISALDLILHAFSQFDIEKAIETCSSSLHNPWFMAHWLDLMYKSGSLDGLGARNATILRNYHLVDYGTLVLECYLKNASGSTAWTSALAYFDECRDQFWSRSQLEARLVGIFPESEATAVRVLQVAKDRGMKEVASSLCKVKSRLALDQGSYQSALLWALRSGDQECLAVATARFFKEVVGGVASGETTGLKVLETLDIPESWIRASNDLAFLATYREFCILLKTFSFNEAAHLLATMMSGPEIPETFRSVLLSDALKLAEQSGAALDTETIMRFLKFAEESMPLLNRKGNEEANFMKGVDPGKVYELLIGRMAELLGPVSV